MGKNNYSFLIDGYPKWMIDELSDQDKKLLDSSSAWRTKGKSKGDSSISVWSATFENPIVINTLFFQITNTAQRINIKYRDIHQNLHTLLTSGLAELNFNTLKYADVISDNEWRNININVRNTQITELIIELKLDTEKDGSHSLGLKNVCPSLEIVQDKNVIFDVSGDKDILDNYVKYIPIVTKASEAADGNGATYWKSEPQPMFDAVVNFYADVTREGAPTTNSAFYIDPLYTNSLVNVYCSDDDNEEDFSLGSNIFGMDGKISDYNDASGNKIGAYTNQDTSIDTSILKVENSAPLWFAISFKNTVVDVDKTIFKFGDITLNRTAHNKLSFYSKNSEEPIVFDIDMSSEFISFVFWSDFTYRQKWGVKYMDNIKEVGLGFNEIDDPNFIHKIRTLSRYFSYNDFGIEVNSLENTENISQKIQEGKINEKTIKFSFDAKTFAGNVTATNVTLKIDNQDFVIPVTNSSYEFCPNSTLDPSRNNITIGQESSVPCSFGVSRLLDGFGTYSFTDACADIKPDIYVITYSICTGYFTKNGDAHYYKPQLDVIPKIGDWYGVTPSVSGIGKPYTIADQDPNVDKLWLWTDYKSTISIPENVESPFLEFMVRDNQSHADAPQVRISNISMVSISDTPTNTSDLRASKTFMYGDTGIIDTSQYIGKDYSVTINCGKENGKTSFTNFDLKQGNKIATEQNLLRDNSGNIFPVVLHNDNVFKGLLLKQEPFNNQNISSGYFDFNNQSAYSVNALMFANFSKRDFVIGGETHSKYKNKKWSPVLTSITVKKGVVEFPVPVKAKYWNFEFTNLTPSPYSTFGKTKEFTYKRFYPKTAEQKTDQSRAFSYEETLSMNGYNVEIETPQPFTPFPIVLHKETGSMKTFRGSELPYATPVGQANMNTFLVGNYMNTRIVEDSMREILGENQVVGSPLGEIFADPVFRPDDRFMNPPKTSKPTTVAEKWMTLSDGSQIPHSDFSELAKGQITVKPSNYGGQYIKIENRRLVSDIYEPYFFGEPSVHTYEELTVNRDTDIAYFAGLKELRFFEVEYVSEHDTQMYQWKNLGNSDWLHHGTICHSNNITTADPNKPHTEEDPAYIISQVFPSQSEFNILKTVTNQRYDGLTNRISLMEGTDILVNLDQLDVKWDDSRDGRTWDSPFYTWGFPFPVDVSTDSKIIDVIYSPDKTYGKNIISTRDEPGIPSFSSKRFDVKKGERITIDISYMFKKPFGGKAHISLVNTDRKLDKEMFLGTWDLQNSSQGVTTNFTSPHFKADSDYEGLYVVLWFEKDGYDLDFWMFDLGVRIGSITIWARNVIGGKWYDITQSISMTSLGDMMSNDSDFGDKTYKFPTFGDRLQYKIELGDPEKDWIGSLSAIPYYIPRPDARSEANSQIVEISPQGEINFDTWPGTRIKIFFNEDMVWDGGQYLVLTRKDMPTKYYMKAEKLDKRSCEVVVKPDSIFWTIGVTYKFSFENFRNIFGVPLRDWKDQYSVTLKSF